MQNFILDKKYNKIHFIGIGGVSMNAIATLLQINGFSVQGSDNTKSNATDRLEGHGVKVFIGHSIDNISKDVDLVVHTAAIKDENVELIFAKEHNIKIIDRATMLGMIIKNYSYPIAIAGTHGKSTTTSIVSKMFIDDEKDPTISVGGMLKEIDGNLRIGKSDYFIFEACEYFDSFLQFKPKVACILNVELDHVDYFSDINHVVRSFNEFSKGVDPSGTLVINKNIEYFEDIIKDVKADIFTFGNEEARVYAKNIVFDEKGYPTFDVIFDGKLIDTIKLAQVGMHNVYNTLCAISVAIVTGLNLDVALIAPTVFTGIDRRFQIKGKYKGATVVDDYAHHQTEMEFALSSAKNATDKKVIAIFQPHTFSRTKEFYKEFAKSLMISDVAILIDIYPARETNIYGISSKDILDVMVENGKKDVFYFSIKDAIDYIKNNVEDGDIVITMGAGDVYKIGDEILKG